MSTRTVWTVKLFDARAAPWPERLESMGHRHGGGSNPGAAGLCRGEDEICVLEHALRRSMSAAPRARVACLFGGDVSQCMAHYSGASRLKSLSGHAGARSVRPSSKSATGADMP
eukprot:3730447-Rhodomonas_salina.2